jgi:hypothetical protein
MGTVGKSCSYYTRVYNTAVLQSHLLMEREILVEDDKVIQDEVFIDREYKYEIVIASHKQRGYSKKLKEPLEFHAGVGLWHVMGLDPLCSMSVGGANMKFALKAP